MNIPRSPVQRPLSPHLSVYTMSLTMLMSIVHRITGVALYFGMILVAWWLLAVAAGPGAFSYVQAFFGSIIGKLILLGYTWALIHHSLGGIRHLIWDVGYGYGAGNREWLARATLVGSIVLTVALWAFGYLMLGV